MILKKRQSLPEFMQNDSVGEYYAILSEKRVSLFFKRVFDIIVSLIFITVASPVFLLLIAAVAISSGFPVVYRQKRVTTCGRVFGLLKFRTMLKNADKIGSLVTVDNDPRITKIGAFLRKYRLDELPQIFNVLSGSMTLVGTRPEVEKYVENYTEEMAATLLLPAGVTSPASILYKDEAELLDNCDDPDEVYVNKILPEKMEINLRYLRDFSLFGDIKILFQTVFGVLK